MQNFYQKNVPRHTSSGLVAPRSTMCNTEERKAGSEKPGPRCSFRKNTLTSSGSRSSAEAYLRCRLRDVALQNIISAVGQGRGRRGKPSAPGRHHAGTGISARRSSHASEELSRRRTVEGMSAPYDHYIRHGKVRRPRLGRIRKAPTILGDFAELDKRRKTPF